MPDVSARASFAASDFQRETGCTDAAIADVEAYRELLATWSQRMNLIGPSALEAFWLRHAYDSAQLLPLAPEAKVWADLGAGAGFPGLILAILFKHRGKGEAHLVESQTKRCRFLSEVATRLELPAVVHHRRAEDMPLPQVEVVTARACAPMRKLLEFAWPILGRKSTPAPIGLFLKGRGVQDELTEAGRVWDFIAERSQSLSDPSGQIVRIERLRRVRPS